MNRAERRQYLRDHRRDPYAIFCPQCKGKTRMKHIPDDEHGYKVFCECCESIFVEQDNKLVLHPIGGDTA